MFFDDNKRIATVIVGKRNSKGKRTETPMANEESKTEDGEIDPMHLAAEDIISAHHEKSPQQLMEALANFIELHQAKGTGQDVVSD